MRDLPRSLTPPGDADWDALARYSAGESDPAERTRVEAWLAEHPQEATLLGIVASMPPAHATVDVEGALARVRGRLAAEEGASGPSLKVERGGAPAGAAPSRWSLRTFAAAAVLVVAIGYAGWRMRAAEVANGPAVNYATRVGEQDTIVLRDGSRVILAPASRLAVAADFATARTVELEGAAFFEVTHDEAHPFTVRSSGAEIRDIGTAFSVSTGARGDVTVSVTEGIVALQRSAERTTRPSTGDRAGVELRAGDRGVVASDGAPIAVSRGTVTADDVAWTHGALVYRDTPLSVVQADLLRWFGVEVRVADSLLHQRTITARFEGDSAAQVVRTIALVLGADVEQRGDTVTLRDAGRGRVP